MIVYGRGEEDGVDNMGEGKRMGLTIWDWGMRLTVGLGIVVSSRDGEGWD